LPRHCVHRKRHGLLDINGVTGLPNPVGCLSFSDPQTDTEDAYYGRVDHNFSPNNRISVSVNLYRQSFVDKFGGGPLNTSAPISGTTTNHFHNITLSESHIFNPRLVNEARVSHNRHFNKFIEGDGTNTIPSIIIDNQSGGCLGFNLGGPFEGGQIEGFVQDRWGASDNLTWSRGRHSLKVGGGMQHGILYRNWDLGSPVITSLVNCIPSTPKPRRLAGHVPRVVS